MQNFDHITQAQRNPIWFNDGLVGFDDARLHVITHFMNYGTAVFEGIRVYDTPDGAALFHLDDHLDRLMASAQKLGIKSRWSKDDIARACIETVRASGQSHGYLRPQLQFGLTTPGLAATDAVEFGIFFWPLGAYRANPVLNVLLSPYERMSPKAGDIEAKVVGFYTNSHFNHQFARENGADDAIMLDVNGNVAEASSSNVFFVKDGVLTTPQTGYILRGITRATVLELARDKLGLEAVEAVVSKEDLRTADEIFLTGTAAEIDPVGMFDGRPVGDGGIGPITEKIRTLYSALATGANPDYPEWRTLVR